MTHDPRADLTIDQAQTGQPWTVPYSDGVINASSRQVPHILGSHVALHAAKSVGKLAAVFEAADHGKPVDEQVIRDMAADLLTAALRLANLYAFRLSSELERRVLEKNGAPIVKATPPAPACDEPTPDKRAALLREAMDLLNATARGEKHPPIAYGSLAARIEHELGLTVPMDELFDEPTAEPTRLIRLDAGSEGRRSANDVRTGVDETMEKKRKPLAERVEWSGHGGCLRTIVGTFAVWLFKPGFGDEECGQWRVSASSSAGAAYSGDWYFDAPDLAAAKAEALRIVQADVLARAEEWRE